MDKSKINQTQLDFSSGLGLANLNLKTGRLLFECPGLTIGGGNYQISTSLIYNSKYKKEDFGNIKIGFGNGWKLNIQQYIFPYCKSYGLDDFSEENGDYVYIDSNWNIHRFVKYKDNYAYGDSRNVYYDASGSGLRLVVEEEKYAEIYDGNNSVIKFDTNGNITNIISSINAEISKTIEYDESNNLIFICDYRKPGRKINFLYNKDGNINKIFSSNYKVSLNFYYNNSNQLDKITKTSGTNTKDMMYFVYQNNNLLSQTIDAESLKALCYKYDIEVEQPKIIEIKEGAMKKQVIALESHSELIVGDDSYVSEEYYLVNNGKKANNYKLEMIDSYVKNKTIINYQINYTDVINEKGITTRYYFNTRDFNSSILEVDRNNSYNCKTLFKTGGWQLSSPSTTSYMINGQSAKKIVYDSEDGFKYSTIKLAGFLDIFEPHEKNGEMKKTEYTENFVISFWLKTMQDITNDVYASVKITKDGKEDDYGKTMIDKARADSWQYITIPVNIGTNQELISKVSVVFNGLQSSQTLYIGDFRIAIGNNTNTKFSNSEKTIDLQDIIKVVYERSKVLTTESISSNFFFTESDLFATYKSLYYKKQKSQDQFDLVCCGGTKVISVNKVTLYTSSCIDGVSLEINDQGIPNYYSYSSNRIAENQWNVTETQIRFHKESANKFYYETKVATQMVEEENQRVEENKAAKIYEWQNADGSPRAKKNEYSIVTAYNYDNYGNLISTTVYNDNNPNAESLVTKYDYKDDEEEYEREKPVSCTQNNVTKYFYYNEPHFTTKYTLEGNSKEDYEYDTYNENIIEIKNINNTDNSIEYKNTIKYDEYGRIKSVTDLSNRTYGFIYNIFGEPLKYYENGNLILEKNVIKGNTHDILIDKIYNNEQIVNNLIKNTAYENITKIDPYGRIISQVNKENTNDDGLEIKFTYQDVNESESVSKIKNILDPYENVTYNYIYDQENRPSGYKVFNQNGEKQIQVRQVGTGDTQYYFSNEEEYIMSQVIKEDSEYDEGSNAKFHEPRIRRTKYVKMDSEDSDKVEENYREFNFEYKYDNLGRLAKKSNEKIEHKATGHNNFINVDKNITYEKSKTTVAQIEYSINFEDKNTNDENAVFTINNKYDNKNNLTEMTTFGQRYIENPTNEKLCDTTDFITRVHTYDYDAFDRLIKETRTDNGAVNLNIEYDYYKNSGNLKKVLKDGTVYKKFEYQNGKISNLFLWGFGYPISYDNYGNVIKDALGTITYNSRNLLDSYYVGLNSDNYYSTTNYSKKINYLYNYQGVRYKKIIKTQSNTKYVKYYVDGSRILGEDWNNSNGESSKSIRYFYDAEGITGLRYDGCNFNFVKDTLGNVSKIMYQGKVIGEYIYDAWGNCDVVELSIDSDATNGARDRFVLQNNPFRWKSHYLDFETGLYFVNGRYYSPVLMQYLNADNIENITPSEVNALNRHAITLDNSITYEVNQDTIFTDTELFPDPTYDPTKYKSWWSLNRKKAIQWIAFAVVFIVSIVLMCIPATSAFGVGMFMAGLKAAVSGAIIGGIIGGVMNFINGNSFMEGLVKGAIEGFINGFTTGALMFCASQAITVLSNAASGRCTSPGHCFIAGTMILTSLGNKKIEDIEIGDEVWAYDEETGEKKLKKVVDLLRNKTKKWVHLLFEFLDGTTEEIVCTEGHPFYVNNLGWVKSIDLLEKDSVLVYNDGIASLISKEVEELDEEEITYNFEVEDYHTYFVGENSILVHNKCRGWQRKKYWKKEATNLKGNGKTYDVDAFDNLERMKSGKAPIGFDKKPVELHHVKGINIDFDDIVQIQKTDHIRFHQAHGYKEMDKLITEAVEFFGTYI